jgi:hypothetical protein
MLQTTVTEFRAAEFNAAIKHFARSHRNCPVEMTFSGLSSDHAADCGKLRRMKLLKEPNGSTQLQIVLRQHGRASSVKTIRRIRSFSMTARTLSIYCDQGIQRNLECLALHEAAGRDKLLAIRHLAELAQA